MMQIRTGQVKHLPLSASQEAMGEAVYMIASSSSDVDRSLIAYTIHYTPSSHSTGLRLAVVLPELSNVKLDTSIVCDSFSEALLSIDKRSLTGTSLKARTFLVRQTKVEGATPTGEGHANL